MLVSLTLFTFLLVAFIDISVLDRYDIEPHKKESLLALERAQMLERITASEEQFRMSVRQYQLVIVDLMLTILKIC